MFDPAHRNVGTAIEGHDRSQRLAGPVARGIAEGKRGQRPCPVPSHVTDTESPRLDRSKAVTAWVFRAPSRRFVRGARIAHVAVKANPATRGGRLEIMRENILPRLRTW